MVAGSGISVTRIDLHFDGFQMGTGGVDEWTPQETTGYGQPPVIEDLKDTESSDQYLFFG